MANGFGIQGSSGNQLDVNASGEALSALTLDESASGFVSLAAEHDTGVVTGSRVVRRLQSSVDNRLRVGSDSVLFRHTFEGTNVSRDRLQQNDTTMTCAQTNGQFRLNSGSSVTSGQGTNVRTYRVFPLFGAYSVACDFWLAVSNVSATGAVSEFGFGYCSGVTAQLTDGVFVRHLSGGQARLVVTNNSTDVSTVDFSVASVPGRNGSGSFSWSDVNHFVITVNGNVSELSINGVVVARAVTVATAGTPTSAAAFPMFARVYNSGAASAARIVDLKSIACSLDDIDSYRPWGHQMCGLGGGGYQIQPGTASGPTVSRGTGATGWPTSATARIAGTWTATSAPALNSLGGSYLTPVISTLTSDADYPVFAWLNPAGTSTLPGKTFYCTGARIGESCATAVASTNSIVLTHIIGVGSTGPTTNVAEAAAAVAARGIVVGHHAFGASDALGTMKPGYTVDFASAPLAVYPGTYLHFIVRLFGTVTSNTLAVMGSFAPVGYFE